MSLGLKQTEANPWDKVDEKYKADMRVKGKVQYKCPLDDVNLAEDERENGYVLSGVAVPASDCSVAIEG